MECRKKVRTTVLLNCTISSLMPIKPPATAHDKGDHLSAHELSRQAEGYSRKAHEESTDVRKTLGQATESKK